MSTTWADIDREEEGETSTVQCGECMQDFTPTPDNERFCTRCNARFEIRQEDSFEFDEGSY